MENTNTVENVEDACRRYANENDELKKELASMKAILGIMEISLKADCNYNTELINRLAKMQNSKFGGFDLNLNWRSGSYFQVLDSKGEHDPVYVVSPNGETFELNHYNDATTDLARAHFMVEALNIALDKIRTKAT